MKKRICSIACLFLLLTTTTPLQSYEPQENLKELLKNLWLAEDTSLLNWVAFDALEQSEKSVDFDQLVAKLRESLEEESTLAQFYESFSLFFSDEEIRELRSIWENPTFRKFNQCGGEIFKAEMQILSNLSKEFIAQYGVPKEDFPSEIFEITEENIQRVVEQSPLPLLIDFYTTSCGPCHWIEPILKDLSRKYNGVVRFAKVNCETQSELARKYGITQLPTFLFVKPSEEGATVVMRISGATTKKELGERIDDFLASLNE